jgi:phage terminase large subunit GpA-like protein
MNEFDQLIELFEDTRSRRKLSTIKPSEWAERTRTMTSADSPWPGPFRFGKAPYMREIVDRLSPTDPAKRVALMCGAQIGKTVNIIENGIGWIIANNPGNILFLTGHTDLSEEAMNNVDRMIDNCGLRSLIRPAAIRAKNSRTGDTNKAKEFPGGTLVSGSASNHKLLRQRSVRFGFIDDFDAAKKATKASGSTRKMIEQRFAAYGDIMKLFYISTPELKESSNIEPVFILGDQRYFNVPCPCCGEAIPLFWTIELEGSEGRKMAGITWKLDGNEKLIPESVGYICQKCGDFFDETHKSRINNAGEWVPTAEPSEAGFYSYHLSTIYAPPGAFGWEHLVRQYLEANPPSGKRKEDLHKTFVNLVLGLPYETQGESPEAKALQANVRNYDIGIIPEKTSIRDGNGKIVMLTCACDLNGTEQDARLDYEIVAWSETGASYSMVHGSIGTFVPMEGRKKYKEDRERWTYEHHRERSVWPELEKIVSKLYITDTPNPTAEDKFKIGRRMQVILTGIDTGHYTQFAYAFIDSSNLNVVGLKGDKESKYRKYDADTPSFKPSRERDRLFLVDGNFVKDKLADLMKLKWDSGNDEEQPAGFMNFPTPSGGLYLFNNYFSHFEAEHKVAQEQTDGTLAYRWVKKYSGAQNHFFDVRIYNYALRDIFVDLFAKEVKMKKLTWHDFCEIIIPK